MSDKLIIAIETVAVALLAIVVVIYGQVIWQRYVLMQVPQPESLSQVQEKLIPLTESQQREMLKKLSMNVEASTSPPRSGTAAQLNSLGATVDSNHSALTTNQQLNMLQKF